MQGKIIFACLLLAFVPAALSLDRDNIWSTLQISMKMCIHPGVKTEEKVKAFMDCYNDVPGKDLFMACQMEAYGRLYDSVENIKTSCLQKWKVPAYGSCLKRDMKANGIDMNEAVRKLNACQLPVLSN